MKIENKKIGKMDDYHYVSIPKALIDTGVLSTEKRYNITIEEIPENNKKE